MIHRCTLADFPGQKSAFRHLLAGLFLGWISASLNADIQLVPVNIAGGTSDGLQKIEYSTSGIEFENILKPELHTRNQISLNGSGVAAADFDGDGLCDLYFCGLESNNRLYRNLGNFRFEDVTEKAGVACSGRLSTGAVMVDFNADFFPDLVVNSIGQGTLVFVNNRDGTFTDVTRGIGFNRGKAGMTFAVADMNGDHFLDFYVTNYRTKAIMDQPGTRFSFSDSPSGRKMVSHINGKPVVGTPDEFRFLVTSEGNIRELGEPDAVFLNIEGRRFEAVSLTNPIFRDSSGTIAENDFMDWGLSARFHDLNGDHLPDLYVCNDFETPDRIWIQEKTGQFQLLDSSRVHRISHFSMGVDFSDINGDGWEDIFVLDMMPVNPLDRQNMLPAGPAYFSEKAFHGPGQFSWNTLLLNYGGLDFIDAGPFSGLSATGWSWAAAFLDLDLDGFDDLLVTNGVERDGRDADVSDRLSRMRATGTFSNEEMFRSRNQFPRLATPDMIFRNLGNLRFEPRTDWGFSEPSVSSGMALADLDNDGDLDVIVNHLNAKASVFRNTSAAPRIQVRLLHESPNTFGITATIVAQQGNWRASRQLAAGGRYLSSDQPVAVFACPKPELPMNFEVFWPDGFSQSLKDIRPNHIVQIIRRGNNPDSETRVSRDDPVSGASRQVLAPAFLPADPIISVSPSVGNRQAEESLRGPSHIFSHAEFLARTQGNSTGSAVSSTFSDDRQFRADLYGLHLSRGINRGKVIIRNPDPSAAPSHLGDFEFPAMLEPSKAVFGDVDADGSTDLLVGFRWNYAKPNESPGIHVFTCTGANGWAPNEKLTASLANVGPHLDFEIADVNGDSHPEIIVPVFLLQKPVILSWVSGSGVFNDISKELGFDLSPGPWISASVLHPHKYDPKKSWVFFGNFGLNNQYSMWGNKTRFGLVPVSFPGGDQFLEVADLKPGSVPPQIYPTADYESLVRQFPFLSKRFGSRVSFSRSPIHNWLPANGPIHKMEIFQSKLFQSTESGRFEVLQLPPEVQFWPVRDAAVVDWNLDGIPDLILATGWDQSRPSDPTTSGGVLPWLLSGTIQSGELNLVPPHLSGFSDFLTTNHVEVADFNNDGLQDCQFILPDGQKVTYLRQFVPAKEAD